MKRGLLLNQELSCQLTLRLTDFPVVIKLIANFCLVLLVVNPSSMCYFILY